MSDLGERMLGNRIADLCDGIARLHRACEALGCNENDPDMQIYCVGLLLGLADENGDWIEP